MPHRGESASACSRRHRPHADIIVSPPLHNGRTRLHNIASLCRLAEKVSTHMAFMGLRLPAILAAAVCAAGCSPVPPKTPDPPLSNPDLDARLLPRRSCHHFIH